MTDTEGSTDIMCRLYGVSRAGYYAWKGRGQSVRTKADEQLWEHIERIYQASGGTYGSPRIHAALKAQGSRVGKKRVERSIPRPLRERTTPHRQCHSPIRHAGPDNAHPR